MAGINSCSRLLTLTWLEQKVTSDVALRSAVALVTMQFFNPVTVMLNNHNEASNTSSKRRRIYAKMKLTILPLAAAAALASTLSVVGAFTQPTQIIARSRSVRPLLYTSLSATSDDDEPLPDFDDNEAESSKNDDDEAAKFAEKAQQLREQIRQMEAQIGDERRARYVEKMENDNNNVDEDDDTPKKKSLKGKRVLILGANGRLGSMITRYLLRTYGSEIQEAVAAVHYVGEATTRGYGRLSYEVGAEDGIGSIGAAWSSEDERNASFQFDPEIMGGYNLNKLRIVEVELLDPVQVQTITEDVDAIIYCATDFDGNRPKAVASLNAAFLFRAIANPTKGRVEIEGLRNCLEGLTATLNDQRWKEQRRMANYLGESAAEVAAASNTSTSTKKSSDPTQFVLVSTCPDAFGNFETPFGEFNGMKRQGEKIVLDEFPSLSSSVLQMGKFDDNFVEEGQELQYAEAEEDTVVVDGVICAVRTEENVKKAEQKRINRRDAARAAVDALLNEDIEGKKVQVYTKVGKTDIW
eukprot:scaffold4423_cov159-Skeletonema_menzelii.AAC.6